jgi:hypothetical protein
MNYHNRWEHKFKIKKDTWVFVPTQESKIFGNSLKTLLQGKWNHPLHFYHLRNGGHVKALKSHKNKNYFIHLDIKNFFGCINKSRVTRNLKKYLGYEKAREAAINSTIKLPESKEIKFILPFGFIQSPIIASICLQCSKLGKYLNKIKNEKGVNVSVYVDDIIISSNDLERLKFILPEIKKIANYSGFPLNTDKEEGPANMITAFNINLSYKSLLIDENRLSKFITNYNLATNIDQKEGILGYISSIDEKQVHRVIQTEN